MKVKVTPYGLRIPPEMSAAIKVLAVADHRSQHSMILTLLDDALRGRHATARAAESGATAFPAPQAAPTLTASLMASAVSMDPDRT